MQAVLRAELEPLTRRQHEELLAEWAGLEARSEASIFQSRCWVRAWLETLPEAAEIYQLRAWHGGELVGLGLFGKSAQTRHKVIRSRMLWLSESGCPELDKLTIEHNNLLIAQGWEGRVWPAAMDALLRQQHAWDQVRISGISRRESHAVITRCAQARGLVPQVEFSKPYFWVDLEGMRPGRGDYLRALSSNTRQQIRRAMKRYEETGPLALTAAGSAEQALQYFDELVRLHQSYWNSKGRAGAFSTEFARHFHRSLIGCGFASNQIQLVKVTAGGDTVGILYNFTHRGRVYNYQAGLVYGEDPKRKPGLVCHALAIEANIGSENTYDFLMGESQYKRSLATRDDLMYWLTLSQPKARFRFERVATQVWRRLCGAFRARGE